MIGRAGSMIGSGGAFASQLSLGGKIRPNWVLVCVALIGGSPKFALPVRDYYALGRDASRPPNLSAPAETRQAGPTRWTGGPS